MEKIEKEPGGDEYGHFAKNMTIIEGQCWKCEAPMKVAISDSDDGMSNFCGPDEFTEEELLFARERGVIIEKQDSKTAEFSYLANTCPHCKTFAGRFHLFLEYVQPASMGDYPSTVHEVISKRV